MILHKEHVGSVWVVTGNGRLDGVTSSAFAKEVGELITGANAKILVDFTGIDFVTSAGLRALLQLVKKTNAAGGVIALCGVNDQVRQVLDIGAFTEMFSVYSGRAEGIAALNA